MLDGLLGKALILRDLDPFRMARARSSAGEHYVDIVGVTGSIPVAPTIYFNGLGRIRAIHKCSGKPEVSSRMHVEGGKLRQPVAAFLATVSSERAGGARMSGVLWVSF